VQGASDQFGLEADSFRRWSFFSFASSVINNNWGVFCTLLDIGVDPNTTNPSPTVSATTFFAATLLAATTYNPIMLAAVLAFGASVETRIPFPDFRTALHLACGKYQDTASSLNEDDLKTFQQWTFHRTKVSPNDLPAMQKLSIWMLLENGANLEAKDYHGNTPLAYALADCPNLCGATMLLERVPPASINAANFSGNTALHEAARDDDLSRLEFCLKYCADLEQQTEMGETALAIATKEGNIGICKRLLLSGARISARDSNGQNCLCLAAQKSQFEVIRLFEASAVEHSNDLLRQLILDEDCRGWNALHTCILKSTSDDAFVGIFETWLDGIENLDLDAQDVLGWSLLHMAVSANQACAEILLERGAFVDVKDSIMGWTPLHHACSEGNADMWNLLLSYGADFYARDNIMGWTPLIVMEQAMDRLGIDENVDFEDSEREHLARKRVRLRERATAFFTSESLNRIVRPITQADIDAQIEINRAEVFPDQLGAVRHEKNVRKLKNCFFMDASGCCRRIEIVRPSQNA
jgi:ankyrin repeat protein